MKKAVVGILFASLLVLVLSGASFGYKNIEWSPITSRIVGPNYLIPEGLKEAIEEEGTKEIVIYNWGDLSWDPATVLNGNLYTQMTGVNVQFVGTPDEQMQPKLQALFMARSPAVDVVPLDETLYMDFVSAGWLEPVDFLWDEESFSHYAGGLESTIINGHHYSVPQMAIIVDMLYYRPSMLQKIGVTEPPTTWEEFDILAQKLTQDFDGDGIIDQWGYAFRGGGVLDGALTLKAASLLLGLNPDDYKDSGKVVYNDPKTIQAVERFVKMRNEWKCVPPGVTAYQHGEVADLFLGGNLAMVIDPTDLYARCAAPDSIIKDDFAMTKQPLALPDGPKTQVVNWNGWAVSKFSKNKAAAFAWLDWYRSLPAQVNEFAVESNVVFLLDAYEDPHSKLVPYHNLVQEILQDVVMNLYAKQGPVYRTVIREFQKALVEEKSAEQAMNDAQKEINDILGQSEEEIKELLSEQ